MSRKTAFVTGATGFLGGALCRLLAQEGWQITALYRSEASKADLAALPIHWVKAELTNAKQLRQVIPPGVDAIFHVAGDTGAWMRYNRRQFQTNVVGTRAMLEAARQVGAKRFIHTSSISAYGDHRDVITESSEKLGAHSKVNYFKTKYLGEKAALEAAGEGMDVVVLNPCNILGPGDRRNWSQLFTRIRDQNIPGIPPGRGSFCHVDEVARAHLAAYERGVSGDNYILGGVQASFEQVCIEVARLLKVPLNTRVVPGWVLTTLGWCKTLFAGDTEPDMTPEKAALVSKTIRVDSSKARTVLGYRDDIRLEKMLRDTCDWLSREKLV